VARRVRQVACVIGLSGTLIFALMPTLQALAGQSSSTSTFNRQLFENLLQGKAAEPAPHAVTADPPLDEADVEDESAPSQLPTWTHTVDYPAGNPFTYTMVGNDPFTPQSSQTTTISAPIIAVKLVFSDGTSTDASAIASDCGLSQSPVSSVLASPLFQNDVSGTQYLDAFQRANFYPETGPSGVNPDYHILLSGTVGQTVTLAVPANLGFSASTSCGSNSQSLEGFVNGDWLLSEIQAKLSTLSGVAPGTLPIFVLYNSIFSVGGDLAAGIHIPSDPQGYVLADYQLASLGDLGGSNPPVDIAAITHETAEWMDDPSGANPVPTWGYVGQDLQPDGTGYCQPNLEVADPLTDVPWHTITTSTMTYHVPDLAFTSWFYRDTPSTAQGGAYSFFGHFTAPSNATVCPAQPVSVSATAGNGTATVKWSEPATTSSIDSFVVEYQSESANSAVQGVAAPSTATTATLPGLTNGQKYDVAVFARSVNKGGIGACLSTVASTGPNYDCSTASNIVTVTPSATAPSKGSGGTPGSQSSPSGGSSSSTQSLSSNPTTSGSGSGGSGNASTSGVATTSTSSPGSSSGQLAYTGVSRGLVGLLATGTFLFLFGRGVRRRLLRHGRSV
jgi:hypothetical protein